MGLAVVLVLVTAGLGTGCGAVPIPCNVTIAALPPESTTAAGDPLPDDVLVLAGPGDFDQTAVGFDVDANGALAVDLQLRGDAIVRFAAHAASHFNEPIAIALNGTVVAIPLIQSEFPDGRIQLSGGMADGTADLAQQFTGCVRG